MRQICFLLITILAGSGAVAACHASGPAGASGAEAPGILIFSHTTGWRHDSIETGIAALTGLARANGYTVVASEDPDVFTDEALDAFDAVILLNTTTGHEGEQWFIGPRGEAFQDFVREGKGVVAIHGAADSHYDWPWYGEMIGGWFERHPEGTPEGELTVIDRTHPSTIGLAKEFMRVDEWYWIQDFSVPDGLLVTLDPTSIGEAGGARPISWWHEFEGGRVFYTAMGHTKETYSDPLFLDHVEGGLEWALGLSRLE
ncbi:ThuA domain-containing protein [Henriciella sp.]|uniref:ThuA domain-containing protein n=1 Tax=Henriciella sp. TaxID=1968823 RepID=UPI00262BD31B|nr:ThuA domain-containing protein [Henriciella sp.]